MEKNRVFQFLAGLNPEFEYAWVHLLDRDPFPNLEEAYSYCLFDQSRRAPLPPIALMPPEASVMAAQISQQQPPSALPAPPLLPLQNRTVSSNQSRPRKRCNHCGGWGHIKDNCWSLHGRPPTQFGSPQHHSNRSQSAAHLATELHMPHESTPFRQFFSQISSAPSTSTSSIANTGIIASANSVSTPLSSPWIIDSGASDNMTRMSSLFRS